MTAEEFIKKKIEESGYSSLRNFAESIGMAQSTLTSILKRGVGNATVDKVLVIAKALNIKMDELIKYNSTDEESQSQSNRGVELASEYIRQQKEDSGEELIAKYIQQRKEISGEELVGKYIQLQKEKSGKELVAEYIRQQSEKSREGHRLVNMNFYGPVSAGKLENLDCTTTDSVIQMSLPESMLGKHGDRKDLFMMKVNGESMNKVMPNGSFIVCVPIELSELKNNDIVIFSYDNDYAIKRVIKSNNSNKVIFRPESYDNSFYDIFFDSDEINDLKIYAKVIFYAVGLN